MNKKYLVLALCGLMFVPFVGRAFYSVHDDLRSTVTPPEYNSIVHTIWGWYHNTTSAWWGIDEPAPDVTLDIAGALKISTAGVTDCTSDIRGVISYHTIAPDTEPHFWGCNGSSWSKLDGIPQ